MIGLSCATLSCDGFGDNDFKDTFKVMPKVGFKYVEFNCWHPSTLTPAKMRDLKERCEKCGLTPSSLLASSFGGDNSHQISKDVTHKIRMMEAARELGCRITAATGTTRGTEGGLSSVITALKEIAPAAEELGIQLCLENHAGNNIENIDDYKRIFDVIDSPNVGICLDTGHFDAAGVDMDVLIDTFRDKIKHIHLKETSSIGVTDFTRFGCGVTSHFWVIDRMISTGYKGFIVVELSPQKDTSTIFEDLVTAKRMFEKYEQC